MATALRLASSNARLQAELRGQVRELGDSRRRMIEAGDAQRRRLERRLRKAAEVHQPKTLILAGGVACNSELREAIRLRPGWAEPLFNLGIVYQNRGELELACEYYQAVLLHFILNSFWSSNF